MEHGLFAGEFADWWENTTSIAGKKDNVGWVVVGDAGNQGILNILNRISARKVSFQSNDLKRIDKPSSVLSQGRVIIIDDTGLGIKNNILKDRTESNSIENIRLFFSRQTNAFGIATSLNIEDTIVTPAVLVVSDQSTLGISREGGLASTRETEEDSYVSILSLVGRRMQSQDVMLDWHFVEEHSEDTLLHLTGIFSTEDDHLLLGEVDGDGGRRSHTSSISVGWEGTSIVDDIVRMETLEFFRTGANQHVAHEKSVIGTRRDNPHADSVALVPSCKAVDDVDSFPSV